MGKNLRLACDLCGHVMRSDHLKKHKANGGCDRMSKRKKAVDNRVTAAMGIKAMIRQALQDGTYKEMKHVFFGETKYAEGKTQADVLALWNVYSQLKCTCSKGSKKQEKPHTHILATRKAPYYHITQRAMRALFSEAKQYNALHMGTDENTFKSRALGVRHFIHTVCYIQTRNGWHVKTHHENTVELFEHLSDNKAFLNELYKDWKWAQVIYIQRQRGKLADLDTKKCYYMTEEHGDQDKADEVQIKIDRLEKKLNKLLERWGEPDDYNPVDLNKDLDEFIRLL